MKNEKKNGLIIGIVIVIVTIAAGITTYFLLTSKKDEPKNEPKAQEIIKKHIAYININPSIKIEYMEKCIDDACEEPIVTTYELINDDAKEIFKNVNLLDGDKTLAAVIETICETVKENNIEFTKVEITSDWEDINDYMNENKEPTDTWTYSVKKEETAKIETIIEQVVEQEQNTKQEESNDSSVNTEDNEPVNNPDNNNSNSNTTTNNNNNQERDNETIYLSDNVKYTMSGEGYCCENCFSDALIREITNAKGYTTTTANSSRIDFKRIILSGSYKAEIYNGASLLNKIKESGAENCRGFGDGEQPLTKEVCTEYHLKCE